MTKSTKLVAALGVAAGIGVAALPFGAFAYTVTPYVTSPDKAEVTVELKVNKAVGIAVASGRSADGSTGGRETTCTASNTLPHTTGTCTHTVTIGANTPATLTLKDADTTTDLTGPTGSAAIPARGGNLTAGTAGWNISGGNLSANTAIVASDADSPLTVSTLSAAGVADVEMTYNFATADNQMAGTYSDVITYTIAAN